MLREWFDDQMASLFVLKSPPPSMDGHYAALSDIPPDVLMDAVGHALKTRAWFPAPAELRADCDAVARRTAPPRVIPRKARDAAEPTRIEIRNPFDGGKPIVLFLTRDWDHDCTNCEDYGFASRWCGSEGHSRYPWMVVMHCNRREEHLPHEWVETCHCINSNQTIQRRRASQVKYSHAPEKVA